MPDCLGLFAKYWEAGKVKTRLAATVGPEKAAGIYCHFVETLLARLDACDAQKCLSYAPPTREKEFRKVAPNGWGLDPQAEGDLGDRMRAFFSRRFDEGFHRVVLLGSDSPQLPLDSIQQAFQLLRKNDVVLGPTEDGGYWLIGAAGGVPEIFDAIPWSTPLVWQSTLDALQAAGHSYGVLPVCYDVDERDNLQRLLSDLKSQLGSDPLLDRLHESLLSCLPSD